MRLQPNPIDVQTRREAAQALVKKGYGKTESVAVRNFQRKARIKVDGIVGPQTMGALRQKDVFSPAKKAAPQGMPSLSGHNQQRPASRPAAPGQPPAAPPSSTNSPAAPNPPAAPQPPVTLAPPFKMNSPAAPNPPAAPEPAAPLPPFAPIAPSTQLPAFSPNPQGELSVGAAAAPKPGQRAELAPRNFTPQQKYDYYAQIVKNNGGTIDPNKPTVLGIRGLDVNGNHHASQIERSRADDTFVVINPKTGQATEVPGITHPAQSSFQGNPTGFLVPGSYVAQKNPSGEHNGDFSWRVYTPQGIRTGNDTLPSYKPGNRKTMDAVLFHRGVGGGITSAGCMSFPDGPWQRFRGALGRDTERTGLNFTLIDAQR